MAHASPKGGYIVEEVTRTILGTKPDGSPITPSSIKYWQAWQVPAGSNVPGNALDSFANPAPPGSTGEDTVSAVARFYEGLTLPSAFAVGKSPYAGERLSSTTDPKLSTSSATLPVAAQRDPPLLKKFPIELFSEYSQQVLPFDPKEIRSET